MDTPTVAGLVLGALGVLTAIVTYWLSRRPKRLGFALAQWIPLLSEAYPEIEVTHRGVSVPNPYFFQVKFLNYGKVEIRPEDFVAAEPLTVTLVNAEIVDASVEVLRNGQVHAATSSGANFVKFQPFLLNPGEETNLAGIASSREGLGRLAISGRIAGVADIRPLTGVGRWSILERREIYIPLFGVILAISVYAAVTDSFTNLFPGLVLYAMLLTPLFIRWRGRRRLRR